MAKISRNEAKKKSQDRKAIREKFRKMRKTIGGRVRYFRRKCDLDIKAFAKKIGLSPGSISNMERGKQGIHAERLLQIALAVGCSPADLLPSIPAEAHEFAANLKQMEQDKAVVEFAKSVITSL